jgi:hypothetical protein
MKNNKVTKVEKFEAIKAFVADNPEYVKFLDAEIARLQARAGKVAEKRNEKNAEKAVAYDEAIRQALANADRAVTLAELVAAIEIEGVTPGRVAYYAGKLVNAGEVERDKAKVGDRKVTVYKLA